MGYERKDFDEKMLKLFKKAENEHQIKILSYYLFSLDWASLEEMDSIKIFVSKNLEEMKNLNKKRFNDKKDFYFYELRQKILKFVFLFLDDRYILQIIHNKQHNYTNIVAFLLNESCQFQGFVYLNYLLNKLFEIIKCLFYSHFEIEDCFDSKMLILYFSGVLNDIYQFMKEILRLFLKKNEKVSNEILLMQFYDCISEFLSFSKKYNSLFKDFKHILEKIKLKKMETIVIDDIRIENLEKKVYEMKKGFSKQNLSTKLSGSL